MDKRSKILILGYQDIPSTGHTWYYFKKLLREGYDVRHVSLLSRYSDDGENGKSSFFINARSHAKITYLLFRLLNKLRIFLSQYSLKEDYCFYNTSNLYLCSAEKILNKSFRKPDVIIVGWCDYFVSPKTLYDLYIRTKASIYLLMVDAHILGGGCHYPCDCDGYRTGCKRCPALSRKEGAQLLYMEKVKYLKDIPFTIVGSSYDAERAHEVSFLKNKKFIKDVYCPQISFKKTKEKARKELGVNNEDFVVMCGALVVSLNNTRKGFKYIIDAINLLSEKITEGKAVTLLLVGEGNIDEYIICNNLKITSLGFVDLDMLITAFYAADIFVSPSIDDSGPVMVNYSISCGTPVVAFPIGIARDLVIPPKTGFLADYLDSNSLSEGIYSFYLKSSDEIREYSDNCISLMESYRNNKSSWLEKVFE